MFNTGLTRFLPPSVRTAIGFVLQRIEHPRKMMRQAAHDRKFDRNRTRKVFAGNDVLVAGLFGTTTGLGRAAELVALTLESQGCKVTRWDVTAALGEPVTRPHSNPAVIPDCTDVICVFNPTLRVDRAFSAEWLLERCVVGHWIYELETVPAAWAKSFRFYDQVWAPTEYVREAIETRLSAPVRVVPYGAHLAPLPRAVRAPSPDFVVGYSFAVNSNYFRKNPEDAVRIFKMAFPDDDGVKLYLRSNDLNDRPRERRMLEAVIGGDSRISIFDSQNRIGLLDFYNAIDVYLSPSKAEGYGLNLVEAAQSGVPVICNGWRLPNDITSLPGVMTAGYHLEPVSDPQGSYADLRNARWAAPDLAEMASLLRSMLLESRPLRPGSMKR